MLCQWKEGGAALYGKEDAVWRKKNLLVLLIIALSNSNVLLLWQKERKEAVGFRKVIDLISQSKKPMVGHNVFLDLCHMVNQFIAPLPQDVKDFKEMVHRRFPRWVSWLARVRHHVLFLIDTQSVIDTKYLAAQAPDLAVSSSSLLETCICCVSSNFWDNLIAFSIHKPRKYLFRDTSTTIWWTKNWLEKEIILRFRHLQANPFI